MQAFIVRSRGGRASRDTQQIVSILDKR